MSLAPRFKLSAVKQGFFDRKAVQDRIGKEGAKRLGLWGMDVRQTDRRSIKPPKQKTLAELTDEEKRVHKIRQRIAKAEGKPAPKKPTKSSAPGEAPRRGPLDLLRRFIFSFYDLKTDSVVIGAAKLNGLAGQDAPENIEYGGNVKLTHGPNRGQRIRMAARPHTVPAYEKHKSKLATPQLWRNLI